MRRLLLILPLCLIVAPSRPAAGPASRAPVPGAEVNRSDALPTAKQLEQLAQKDVIAFLKACILRYEKEVRGYQAVLVKQEFISGKLNPVETADVWFRDDPFSVLMRWRGECVGRADRALYVRGANDDKTLAHPKNRAARLLVGDVVARDTDGPDARAVSRYSLREFGLRKGTERTLAAWEAARKRGNLHVEYLGIRPLAECDNRPCYMLRRTCDPPEEDGIATVEVAFDVANWLQIGNVLTAGDGKRIAAYHFREVVLNPTFPPDQFERIALTRD
jgi:Protein of unknown function (DUF1571)